MTSQIIPLFPFFILLSYPANPCSFLMSLSKSGVVPLKVSLSNQFYSTLKHFSFNHVKNTKFLPIYVNIGNF